MSLLKLLARAPSTPSGPRPQPVDDTPRWENHPAVTRHFSTPGGLDPNEEACTAGTWRTAYTAVRPARTLAVTTTSQSWTGWGTGTYTQRLAIERTDGTFTALTYAGQPQTTISPETVATTDTLTLDKPLLTGERFWIRTYREGDLHSVSGDPRAGDGEGYRAGQDLTTGGTWSAFWNGQGRRIQHRALIGETPDDAKTWALIGSSSIAAAASYGAQACQSAGAAYTQWAQSTRSQGNLMTTIYRGAWFGGGKLLAGVDGIVYAMGRNDLGGGTDFPQSLADAQLQFMQWAREQGFTGTVIQTTMNPRTNSTDRYATVEGQKHYFEDTARVKYNDWLRDGAPCTPDGVATPDGSGTLRMGDDGHPWQRLYDLADLQETARNSGIWKVGLTTDGLHPSAECHKLAGEELAKLLA